MSQMDIATCEANKPTSLSLPNDQPHSTYLPIASNQPVLTTQPVANGQPLLTSLPSSSGQVLLTSRPVSVSQPHLTALLESDDDKPTTSGSIEVSTGRLIYFFTWIKFLL